MQDKEQPARAVFCYFVRVNLTLFEVRKYMGQRNENANCRTSVGDSVERGRLESVMARTSAIICSKTYRLYPARMILGVIFFRRPINVRAIIGKMVVKYSRAIALIVKYADIETKVLNSAEKSMPRLINVPKTSTSANNT